MSTSTREGPGKAGAAVCRCFLQNGQARNVPGTFRAHFLPLTSYSRFPSSSQRGPRATELEWSPVLCIWTLKVSTFHYIMILIQVKKDKLRFIQLLRQALLLENVHKLLHTSNTFENCIAHLSWPLAQVCLCCGCLPIFSYKFRFHKSNSKKSSRQKHLGLTRP